MKSCGSGALGKGGVGAGVGAARHPGTIRTPSSASSSCSLSVSQIALPCPDTRVSMDAY